MVKIFNFLSYSIIKHSFLFVFILIGSHSLASAKKPLNADAVKEWIINFKPVALSKGITEKTFSEAFDNISSPDFSVLPKARYQPEFIMTLVHYLSRRISANIIKEGQEKSNQYADILEKINKNTGVDKNILLAIWAAESSYGRALKNPMAVRDIFNSLSVLAYADDRRSQYAQKQLIAALKILQSGKVKRKDLVGSWAGAMGHTQFIPTSYLAFAKDINGNSWPNIWHSIPDALASSANLLKTNGWIKNQKWGYEVLYPYQDIKKFDNKNMSFAEWQKLGIIRADKKNYPNLTNTARLLFPDGVDGPIFLVTKNFSVLKTYNNANRYALLIGILADRISGELGLSKKWVP
ncbi:lytic murein transglycosylase [Bartonella sp. DGB1]|uniref:lytic murein transglycosylase n=1 Tax=Bartonella sp. DGB1 TaxID=3239807 RepID=UPI00352674FE